VGTVPRDAPIQVVLAGLEKVLERFEGRSGADSVAARVRPDRFISANASMTTRLVSSDE
jgi:hypothetical protein